MFDIAPSSTSADHDGHPAEQLDLETTLAVHRILIRLADDQDNAAASEAAEVPYWKACPDSVRGRRAAARALRGIAESFSIRTPQVGS